MSETDKTMFEEPSGPQAGNDLPEDAEHVDVDTGEVSDAASDAGSPLKELLAKPRATIQHSAETMQKMWPLVEAVANAKTCPTALRGDKAGIHLQLVYGNELGISTAQALQHLHVVNGKVGMSAELMRALIYSRSPGSVIRPVEWTAEKCVLEGVRPGHEAIRVEWSKKEAESANLIKSGGGWDKHPRDMVMARATTRLARFLWPDVLGGMGYTPEELGEIDPADSPAANAAAPKTAPRADRQAAGPAAPTPVDVFKTWEKLYKRVNPKATRDQMKEPFRKYIASIAKADVQSSSDMTPELVSACLDDLGNREDWLPLPADEGDEE